MLRRLETGRKVTLELDTPIPRHIGFCSPFTGVPMVLAKRSNPPLGWGEVDADAGKLIDRLVDLKIKKQISLDQMRNMLKVHEIAHYLEGVKPP